MCALTMRISQQLFPPHGNLERHTHTYFGRPKSMGIAEWQISVHIPALPRPDAWLWKSHISSLIPNFLICKSKPQYTVFLWEFNEEWMKGLSRLPGPLSVLNKYRLSSLWLLLLVCPLFHFTGKEREREGEEGRGREKGRQREWVVSVNSSFLPPRSLL